jgi:(p)ppGpp synthase/HD superfamily hydrolase
LQTGTHELKIAISIKESDMAHDTKIILPENANNHDTPAIRHYKGLKKTLRYALMGRASCDPRWYIAVKALDLGVKYHKGFRKDGKTPEFQHQIEIALYLLTMEKLMIDAPRTIADALLHDLGEDYGDLISFEEIGQSTDTIVQGDCSLLAKEYRGEKKSPDQYFGPLSENFRVSLVKGADRVHNMRTMAGVFKLEKQQAYCIETREYFFDFLKLARRAFPEQEPIYENIKFMLTTQLGIYESINAQGYAA